MPRVAFIFRTDAHLADRAPESWKAEADYTGEIFSNLEQVGEFARVHNAAAVLDGGDYFNVKAASRNSHMLVARSALIHKAYPCNTWSVEGNHDLSYNDVGTLDKQPLGVLFASGVLHQLRDHVFEGGFRVRVVGLPYSPDCTLEKLRSIQKQPGDRYLVAVIHQLASENPPPSVAEFFKEPVFRYSDLVSENGPDVWCFGHWHKDQGITSVSGKQFVNLGAVSRGALINENLHRTPKVALIECGVDGIKVSALELNVPPADQVFDLEKKQRREEENKSIDEFILRLQQDATVDSSASIEANIEALGFAKEVRDAALDYLDRARAEVG